MERTAQLTGHVVSDPTPCPLKNCRRLDTETSSTPCQKMSDAGERACAVVTYFPERSLKNKMATRYLTAQ